MIVKLEQIMEGMMMQSEESRSFLNPETGEIVYVSQEALLMAEDGEEYEHLADWQLDEVKLANDIVDNFDKYVEFPSSFSIHEYSMMKGFCYSLSDHKLQVRLLESIRRKGAFQRFKESVNHLGIEEQWYAYRDNQYKEIAMKFCVSNNIDFKK
ncbi:MAG: UPF0158 family protein [Neobacillus sp.]